MIDQCTGAEVRVALSIFGHPLAHTWHAVCLLNEPEEATAMRGRATTRGERGEGVDAREGVEGRRTRSNREPISRVAASPRVIDD